MERVAIPIETKTRELDGKLWLGANLVKKGYGIVLGSANEIRNSLDILQLNYYISKDPGDGNKEFFKILQRAGISVLVLDAEGGVYESDKIYTKNKRKVLNTVDAFLAWGRSPAKALREHYSNPDNIFITGNPRFDLLQPHLRFIYQDRSVPLNEQYGDYILFNGNFSFANPFRQQVITKYEELYGPIPQEKLTYRHRTFHLFLDSLYHLHEEFPETNIIIRPHPSESNQTYEEAFQEYDRIHIEDTGDVRNWIAGANVTVHHDCTTGIESALMGVPVASYRPVQNEEYRLKLPQIVSEQVFTLDELTEYISQNLCSNRPYQMDADQTAYLKQYFHNVDESAAEKICNVINTLEERTEKDYNMLKPDLKGSIERRVKSSNWSNQIITVYDAVQKLLLSNESRQEHRQYHRQKFPGLNRDEILQQLEQMEQFLDIGSVSVEPVALTNDTFYIRPE